jgi:hypothetical protein
MAGEARRRPVPREIPEKLRLTAAVLGCATRKELCARFRAASPATRFDLERANKWMQGRALPRDASVYDDWARAVGTARPGAWLAACTAAELAAELAALHGLPEAAPPREGAAGGAYAYLGGDYACYSPSWSPYQAGRLIRGAMALRVGGGGRLAAVYAEALGGRTVRFEGAARVASRSVHVAAFEAASGLPVFLSLHQPGPPAGVMAGVMAGAAMMAAEARPTACRALLVRAPAGAAALAASNRYLEAAAGAVAADLAALGLRLGAGAEGAAGLLLRFLAAGPGGAPDQVTAAEQARLAEALDPAFL